MLENSTNVGMWQIASSNLKTSFYLEYPITQSKTMALYSNIYNLTMKLHLYVRPLSYDIYIMEN